MVSLGRIVVAGAHLGSFLLLGLSHENSVTGGRYVADSVVTLWRPRDGTVTLRALSSRTGAFVRIVPLDLIGCVVASTSFTVLTFVLVVRVAGALVLGSSIFCSLAGGGGPRVRAAPRVGVARVNGEVRSGAVVVTFLTVFFGPSMSFPSQIGASQPFRQISMSHFKKT